MQSNGNQYNRHCATLGRHFKAIVFIFQAFDANCQILYEISFTIKFTISYKNKLQVPTYVAHIRNTQQYFFIRFTVSQYKAMIYNAQQYLISAQQYFYNAQQYFNSEQQYFHNSQQCFQNAQYFLSSPIFFSVARSFLG